MAQGPSVMEAAVEKSREISKDLVEAIKDYGEKFYVEHSGAGKKANRSW